MNKKWIKISQADGKYSSFYVALPKFKIMNVGLILNPNPDLRMFAFFGKAFSAIAFLVTRYANASRNNERVMR